MITVKEEFLAGAKAQRAIAIGGWETIGMWLALKGYAATHPTDGFVPDEDVDRLPGAPKNPRKVLGHLVDCGALQRDGKRGAGLVDKVPLGWQLHDYLDHATSGVELEVRKGKDRHRKAVARLLKAIALAAGVPESEIRRRHRTDDLEELAELRRRYESGDESADSPEDESAELPPDSIVNIQSASADSSADSPEDASCAGTRDHAIPAQPSPAQPSDAGLRTTTEDLSGSAREGTPAVVAVGVADSAVRIPCPQDLALPSDVAGGLQLSIGLTAEGLRNLTASFVAASRTDPTDMRTLGAWRKCLAKAVTADWNRGRGRGPTDGAGARRGAGGPQRGHQPPDAGDGWSTTVDEEAVHGR